MLTCKSVALFCQNSVEVMKARLGSDIIRCVGYGHIGDGNMHLNITSKAYSHQVMDKIEPFLYEWTSQQKGSISAEHGIKDSCDVFSPQIKVVFAF